MGVYLLIIWVSDRIYDGEYLWHEYYWRHSPLCAIAGFLSLLSNEASSLIMCLITLDRFLVLRFPFTNSIHLGPKSAQCCCICVWIISLLLACLPFTFPSWDFYHQTGMCIPLPITRAEYRGKTYSFAVVIVLNFTLFIIICLGQMMIFWSVKSNTMKDYHDVNNTKQASVKDGRKDQDVKIARRLLTVAMSDFLCWFPIGLFGLLAHSGVPVSSQVVVVMTVMVLPINSALNPFLYTINVILEKRRTEREKRLKKYIISQINAGQKVKPSLMDHS